MKHTIITIALLMIMSLGLSCGQVAPGDANGVGAIPDMSATPGVAGNEIAAGAVPVVGVPGGAGAVAAVPSAPEAATTPMNGNATAATISAAAAANVTAPITPEITVNDQTLTGNTITVARAVSDGPGWIVIHNNLQGGLGGIIGWSHVNSGENTNVAVTIDPRLSTSVLHAELHRDLGVPGAFEFPAPDVEAMVGGNPVAATFSITGAQIQEPPVAVTPAPVVNAMPAVTGAALVGEMPPEMPPVTEPVAEVVGGQAVVTSEPATLGQSTATQGISTLGMIGGVQAGRQALGLGSISSSAGSASVLTPTGLGSMSAGARWTASGMTPLALGSLAANNATGARIAGVGSSGAGI